MEIRIRPESPADVSAIEDVTTAAFLEAPHTSHTEQFIVNALRRSGALSVSLVAEVNGTVIGHVALSPVSISDGTPGWFGLGPISVAPAHQSRGVGSALMREAIRALRARDASGCVLVGDPEWYRRFGFRAEAALLVPDVPARNVLALGLDAPMPQGEVTFDEAFKARS